MDQQSFCSKHLKLNQLIRHQSSEALCLHLAHIYPASTVAQHSPSSWSWILEQQREPPGTGLTLATSVPSAHTLMMMLNSCCINSSTAPTLGVLCTEVSSKSPFRWKQKGIFLLILNKTVQWVAVNLLITLSLNYACCACTCPKGTVSWVIARCRMIQLGFVSI